MSWIQDAGHGGADPGAVAKGNTEKIYTLEAALYVDKRLAELGVSSDVTRSSDVTLDQGPRTAKVKKYKKAISHHLNAGGGSGVEAIHSIKADGKFENMLIEEFRKAGYPLRPRPVYFKKYGNGDYYYMHRETGACRTTIIEYDFVDGPQSEKIKDKAYREGMYECVVRAICRDEGVAYKAPGQLAQQPTPQPSNVEVKVIENSEYVGKKLIVKNDGLWFYNAPRWEICDGTSDKGHNFTITQELLVNGRRMVKCHDGKYRTADPNFVDITPKPLDWPYSVNVENITHKNAQEIVSLISKSYPHAKVYGVPK